MPNESGTFLPLLQTLAGAFAALAGVVITQVWTTRRDNTKRRLDLAEEVLALFYEAADAIRFIRSPAQPGDGSTRPRREGERPEEAAALDRAYIFDERCQKRESTFAALRAKRYRFMATFRGDSRRPFEIIDGVMHKLYIASNILGQYYWQKRAELPMPSSGFVNQSQLDEFLEGMRRQEAVFCALSADNDPITPIVAEAVRAVEAIADKAARAHEAGFREWWRRWNECVDNTLEAGL